MLSSSCLDNWNDLAQQIASTQSSSSSSSDMTFEICRNATLRVTNASDPIEIWTDNTTIVCSNDMGTSANTTTITPNNTTTSDSNGYCTFSGQVRDALFRITGRAKHVLFSGLDFVDLEGGTALIQAVGRADASATLQDCHFVNNKMSAAAVLVYNENEGSTISIQDDLKALRAPSEPSMTIKMNQCSFMDNSYQYSNIVNMGGTLFVESSYFESNAGGDELISVSNEGSLHLESSCFVSNDVDRTMSLSEDSQILSNTNNYASDATAATTAECNGMYQATANGDGICVTLDAAECPSESLVFRTKYSNLSEEHETLGILTPTTPSPSLDGPSGGKTRFVHTPWFWVMMSFVMIFLVAGVVAGVYFLYWKKKQERMGDFYKKEEIEVIPPTRNSSILEQEDFQKLIEDELRNDLEDDSSLENGSDSDDDARHDRFLDEDDDDD